MIGRESWEIESELPGRPDTMFDRVELGAVAITSITLLRGSGSRMDIRIRRFYGKDLSVRGKLYRKG